MITVTQLRKAIKGLPGDAVLVPSNIWEMLVKKDGEVIGYLTAEGFRKFEPPKEEPPKCRKDTNVQEKDVHLDMTDLPTAQIPVVTADGWPGPQPQSAPPAESPGCPGDS
jgi:hypothetical protein